MQGYSLSSEKLTSVVVRSKGSTSEGPPANGAREDLKHSDEYLEDTGRAREVGYLKTFRLLAGIYRGREERYGESALMIAGLHDYRGLGKLS